MKKLSIKTLMCVLFAAILTVIMTVSVLAETTPYPATEEDAIKNGEAKLDVQYKAESPVVDGKIEVGEYYEVPAESLVDYYNFVIGDCVPGYTPDEKYAILLDYVRNSMKVYACWDGKNFCFALTASAPSYEYTCPTEEADSVRLYNYWCTQCAFAAPNAAGGDRFEVGLGASSDNIGECFAYESWGTRSFQSFEKGENFYALYNNVLQTVTYEVKVNIKEITGVPAAEGGQMRFLFLLSQSGQATQDSRDFVQIQCGYGCAAEKMAEWFLMVNFKGLPENETLPDDTEEYTEEAELEGFWNKTDFRKDSVVDLITEKNNVIVEKKTDDNGDKYINVTATGSDPYFGGPKIPVGLNGSQCQYFAIHYRTTSTKSAWIGLSYQSHTFRDDSDEYMYSNDYELYNDGEWHTTVIDMSAAPEWGSFITNMRVWLFVDNKDDVSGESIDIMWFKYYTEEPEFDDSTGTKIDENTTAEEATTIEEITTIADVATTVEEAEAATTEAVESTTTVAGDEKTEKGGCGGIIAVSALAILSVAALPVFRKKE